jgi:Lrp/AsnC family leucine-responsive transcriptional regulator
MAAIDRETVMARANTVDLYATHVLPASASTSGASSINCCKNQNLQTKMKLDTLDLRILAELQQDGALSNVELARRVHLSPSPCLARVKALEAAGVIDRYVAIANAAALGLGLNVFISISLKTQSKESLASFEQSIALHDEVMECYLMTGDSDYLIRVAVADMAALEKFIVEQLTPIPGIEKIRSSFALKQVRYKTALPLPINTN